MITEFLFDTHKPTEAAGDKNNFSLTTVVFVFTAVNFYMYNEHA
jgi:hypothetical protein